MSPTTDQQLASKLQKLAQELATWREAMCVPGPGCACTNDSLCALRTASSPMPPSTTRSAKPSSGWRTPSMPWAANLERRSCQN
ncbi:MAG: hypothetical protein ACOYYS_09960 [Chloroflexota bacterium]